MPNLFPAILAMKLLQIPNLDYLMNFEPIFIYTALLPLSSERPALILLREFTERSAKTLPETNFCGMHSNKEESAPPIKNIKN